MAEEQQSLIHVLRGLLRVITAVAGAVVGVGTLAFSAGFLAQRAQYDFVQVPFVFIDYWAYAETGLMSLVQSINLFVGRPLCLALLGLASVAIVLALECRRFRRAVLRPHWTFLGYLVLILWLGVVLRQQMAVRELRDGPIVQETVRADGSRGFETTTVPARLPFRLAVPAALDPPAAAAIDLPPNSVELWNRIADDLEREVPEGAVYLEVRPKPSWAVVLRDGEASRGATPVLGAAVDPARLDSARARELYRVVLSAFLVGVWFFVVLGLWQRRVYDEIGDGDAAGASSGFDSILHRLREELWFCSKWILRGVAALLLVTTGLFLMPECYGLLAMPRLGQEYVEVTSAASTPNGREESEQQPRGFLDVETMERKAIEILNDFTATATRDKARRTWRQQIAVLERTGSAEAAQVLKMMANASIAISSDLSDTAREALSRITFAAAEGFILYYPRSETEYLRLLQRNPHSATKRWTVYPVKMADIVDIRVKRDERTVELVRILRRMSDLDPQNRRSALIEAEKLGHGRLLEVAVGGTYDPSHKVRAFALTDIGRYAAGLPADGDHRLRRQLASRRILEVLRDPAQRGDHRGAASTSLHGFVATGDPAVCAALVKMLESTSGELGDEGWVVRGSMITSIGRLRCRTAVPRLLELVVDRTVPVHVRATIPTQLIRVGTHEDSAETLGELAKAHDTPADVAGAAVAALAMLEGKDTRAAVEALQHLLLAERYSDELEAPGKVSEYRMAIVDALEEIGDPRCVDTLHLVSDAEQEQDQDVRVKAVIALGEFEDPRSEGLLIDLAEDPDEPDPVRYFAIASLRSFHDNRVARRLVELHPKVPQEFQEAIVISLALRGRSGSRYAEAEAEALGALNGLAMFSTLMAEGGAVDPGRNGARQLEAVRPQPLGLRVGDEVEGVLDAGDGVLPDGSYAETVSFSGEQGRRVTVELLSNEFDAYLSVAGPGLELPLADDDGGGGCNARITLTLPETGTYFALVNSATEGPATGDFVLRISEDPPPPLDLPCGLPGV